MRKFLSLPSVPAKMFRIKSDFWTFRLQIEDMKTHLCVFSCNSRTARAGCSAVPTICRTAARSAAAGGAPTARSTAVDPASREETPFGLPGSFPSRPVLD